MSSIEEERKEEAIRAVPYKTILRANLTKFNYENRIRNPSSEEPVPEYLLKLDNRNYHTKWNFWQDVFKNAVVNYFRDMNTGHTMRKYKLIEKELLHDTVKKVSKLYYKDLITDNGNNWFQAKIPNVSTMDVDNEDIHYFDKDPIYARKVIIDNSNAKILLLGDFHSGFHSLGDIIEENRDMFVEDSLTLNVDRYIIFLGDLLDRGPYNMEILYLAYLLKLENEDSVFIINGNHENEGAWSKYGAKAELKDENYETIDPDMKAFEKCLWYLPSVIYLNYNNKNYHLSHGSFDHVCGDIDINLVRYRSSDQSYKDLESIVPANSPRVEEFLTSNKLLWYIADESLESLPTDLFKWGDMQQEDGIKIKVLVTPVRLIDRLDRPLFGKNIIQQYLTKNNIECIISGHQDMVPLGIIIPQEEANKEITIDNVEFKHWDKVNTTNGKEQPVDYDFYVPTNSVKWSTDKDPINIKLQPKEDFLALVTSSATIARSPIIDRNSYLIMETERSLTGGHRNLYYRKYLQCKTKYLKLKKSRF